MMNLRFLLSILFFTLTACGFHLRGFQNTAAWMQSVDVQSTQNSDLIKRLKSILENQTIHPSIRYHLVIEREAFNQQLVSVGAGTNPRQYLLEYTVQFHLIDNQAQTFLPQSTVRIVRQVTSNNERILGSNEEERTIQDEMKNDAISQILLRIGSRIQTD